MVYGALNCVTFESGWRKTFRPDSPQGTTQEPCGLKASVCVCV